jgi:uncharacterized protein
MSVTKSVETKPQSLWHQLLTKKLSRRAMIQTAVAAGAASVVKVAEAGTANNGAPFVEVSSTPSVPIPFTPIEKTFADTLTLPQGYTYKILAPWGEAFTEQGDTFGFNHDFVGYFPIDMLEGGQSATDGLLTINHEYPNPLFVGGNTEDPSLPDQVQAHRSALGVSVVRIRKDGEWNVVMDPLNRRLDGYADIELTGPAAGADVVAGATMVKGTVGNCSGGQTPWGTLLTCEENVDDYAEYWGSDYNPMHQGWITEIDPFDVASTPRKHTAMGRFRHENAAVVVAADNRVVVYMGDDKRDACVYKFVSRGTYSPADRAANLNLLETGDLYVADFRNGKWLLLDYDNNPALKEATNDDGTPLFSSQAEVLADALSASLAIGGTPVDRPEDIEIHPRTGDVYIALTNNSNHGNFFGQIVKLTEDASNWSAESFRWEIFAVGGAQSGFSSPDNLVFDPYGNLWMVTDSGTGEDTIYDFLGNNSMFFFPTEGPDTGKAFRFAVGPVQAEMTGPVWSPDGKTLFVAIQHPGEDSESLDALTSSFAAAEGTNIPRPTLVAIEGFPGWTA